YGRALSQVTTVSLMRLADAAVLPFEFQTLAKTVRGYVDEVAKAAPSLDLKELQGPLARLANSAKIFDDERRRAAMLSPERLAKLNETLARAEHTLLLQDGLPGREWYRHQLYAPGLYTGYGAKTIPGVREAAEVQRWDEAVQQV